MESQTGEKSEFKYEKMEEWNTKSLSTETLTETLNPTLPRRRENGTGETVWAQEGDLASKAWIVLWFLFWQGLD